MWVGLFIFQTARSLRKRGIGPIRWLGNASWVSLRVAWSLLPLALALELAANEVAAASYAWRQPDPIQIRDGSKTQPYPSTISALPAIPGIVTDIKVELSGITHGRPADLDILLVGPGGQAVTLLSDGGGKEAVNNVFLLYSTNCVDPPAQLEPLVTGCVAPVNYDGPDLYPEP